MKSKIKKTLIIISSAIVLFLGVFFMTRSLNNLLEGSDKDKTISIENNSPNTISDKSDNLDNNKTSQTDNAKGTADITNNAGETNQSKTTNSLPTEKYTDYIVQKGDTLFSIARKAIPWKSQQEAVKILETMNNLQNREVIPVGARLMVPVNSIDATGCTKYTVKSGESLYTIAEDYLPDMNPAEAVDMIMNKNNITDPKSLSVGLEIYIPTGNASSVNSKETTQSDEESDDSEDTTSNNNQIDSSNQDKDDE